MFFERSFHLAEINFPPHLLCFKARAPGTLVRAQPPPPPAHLQRAVSASRKDLVRHGVRGTGAALAQHRSGL